VVSAEGCWWGHRCLDMGDKCLCARVCVCVRVCVCGAEEAYLQFVGYLQLFRIQLHFL
jgi:hypothetical protein